MSAPRVLHIVHGHPALSRGGAEQSTLELYEAMREKGEFEPFLAARTGDQAWIRPDTRFGAVNDDPNQILFFTGPARGDSFLQTMADKSYYTRFLDRLLRSVQPDLVHFQHTLFIGLEAIRQVRASLPGVPIVYTLHEYLPICHADGQMIRTRTQELCTHASPQRCHECFPDIAPSRFFVRERFIKAQLALVDRFVAPSRFLLERFVDWGIPREKLVEIDYGRLPVSPAPPRRLADGERRTRFGYFGQLIPNKGVLELLLAMRQLGKQDRDDIHLLLSGANLERQAEDFRNAFHELLADTSDNVTFLGRYDPTNLGTRMALVDWVVVPSIWWENSPLVIQEAFLHGRPVICSNIGGMAEKVVHGTNGLHFQVRDPRDLGRALVEAAYTDGLWERLRGGIPPIPSASDAAARHAALYRDLLGRDVEAQVRAA